MFRRTHRVIQQGGGGPPSVVTKLPVVSAVDPVTGNLLVYGQPFLMIRGEDLDYLAWLGNVGYTLLAADVYLQQARSSGVNTLFGNWSNLTTLAAGLFPGGFDQTILQDLQHQSRQGWYWHGSATVDNLTGGGGDVTSPINPDPIIVARIVNRYKARSGLVLWDISSEIQGASNPPSGYQTGYRAIQNTDPTRTAGDDMSNVPGIPAGNQPLWFDLNTLPIPWGETTMGTNTFPFTNPNTVTTSASTHAALKQIIDIMQTQWDAGHRFVMAINITPIIELNAGGSTVTLVSFSTTSNTPVTPGPGLVDVTPAAMSGINQGVAWQIQATGVGSELLVDTGIAQEFITVVSTTATTFRAIFGKSHSGTWAITGQNPATYMLPSRFQIRREFLYPMARNNRAITILWGPNQRGYPFHQNGDPGLPTTVAIWKRDSPITYTIVATGIDGAVTDGVLTPYLDNGRAPSVLDVWGYVMEVCNDISGVLKPVILDGQRWTHLTTNPQDSGSGSGVYAASKTIAGITYVIAVNQDTTQQTWGGQMFAQEHALSTGSQTGASITVGTGTTCIRLFEAGSPPFSGGIITDDFRPMETHVYKVT